MKPQEKPASTRRIVVYSILLYTGLLLAEIGFNIFAFVTTYSTGKVHSTFFAKLKESAGFLKYQVVMYLILLVAIYIVFGLINSAYVIFARDALLRKFRPKTPHLAAFLFLGINVFFIITVYLTNAVRYPYSKLSGLLMPKDNSVPLQITIYILLAVYLLGFVWVSLQAKAKKVKWAALAFWAVVLVSPLQPAYHFKSLLSPLFTKSNNTGPNVILIGIDSLAPSHMGYFGYSLNTTPHLDKFLSEAVIFKNCFSPIARTFPGWYSILTGQYPVTSGVRLNLMKRHHISPNAHTVPQILKDQKGYFTAFFADETRFCNIRPEDGFDYLEHPLMGIRDFVFGSIHDFSLPNVFFNGPLGYLPFDFIRINRAVSHIYQSRYFANELVSYLDVLQSKEKFFLMINFVASHWPYFSSSPYPLLFQANRDPMINLYDGAIRMADDQFGRLIESLKRKNLYDKSLIIVLSDHGESEEGHGTTLRATDQNRTLLAIKPAGSTINKEIETLVRTIDIAPTVYDLLPGTQPNTRFDGFSLKPLIAGAGDVPELADSRIIMETEFSLDAPGGIGLALQEMIDQGINFYEFDKNGIITVKDEFFDRLIKNRQRAIQTKRWKLIWEPLLHNPRKKVDIRLFDLEADPRCRRDVSALFPEVFQELLSELRQFYGVELD
ncbi:MAG: sulfatase [Candidatus Aminicenantes bacterium]|nr:sulfatase [Candidatus Aminicenantes bacterium]